MQTRDRGGVAPPTALLDLGATEIAAEVAAGTVRAADVVEAHIARIEAVNGALNAVVTPRFEQARAEARALDERRERGEPLGPLAGVPFTVKDQFDVAGLPTTFGLPGRRDRIATADAPTVARLRAAGAIALGKTNVPQLLFFAEGDNPLFGRTNNPWDRRRTTGGGSAGEGAILAAGGSALGLAADIGGSIRTPAHFCGIHGFRPTSRRVTIQGSPPELFFPGFGEIALDPGVMGRSVSDLSLAMAVLARPLPGEVDPRVPPVPWTDPRGVEVAGLRIATFDDDGYWPASPAIRRAVAEAAEALRGRGAEVRPFAPPGPGTAIRLYGALLSADGLAWAKTALGDDPVDKRVKMTLQGAALPRPLRAIAVRVLRLAGQPRMAANMLAAGRRSVSEYRALVQELDAWRDGLARALEAGGFDAVICPPHPLPALRHGQTDLLFDTNSYAALFNVAGMPAGAVAATRVRAGEESDRPRSRDITIRAARRAEEGSAGLPVGVQVAAPHWRDEVCLAVMAALEAHFRAQPDFPARPPS